MMEFESLKRYRIKHSRKGTFEILVTDQNAEWLTGQITTGKANAMLSYNRKCPGDEITVRKRFIVSATEL